MTPEWRCRKCGHEWDESNPSQLTPTTRNESVFRPPEAVATASASGTRPDSPVGSNDFTDEPWFEWVAGPAIVFVVSLVGLYVLYLIIGLFLGTILGGEIPVVVVLGVGLLVLIVWGLAQDGSSRKITTSGIVMLLSVCLAYALLFFFVVWASGTDRPPSDPDREQCSVRDRGGRIKENCW